VQALDGTEMYLIGLIDQDWTKACAGALALLGAFAALETGGTVAEQRFFQILAGAGAYAATYNMPGSNNDVQKARAAVLDSIIRGLVNRSHRNRGAVFSLGGAFGLGGVYRRSFDGRTTGGSWPFLLPLGVGMQTYGEGMGGFHMQLGVIDVGQYVAWESGQLNVGTPRVEQAVALSLTVGYWGLSREVPLFVGPQFGVSPFIRSDGNPAWFVGGMIGAYVPFLDFN
jgi:hypothetical protein